MIAPLPRKVVELIEASRVYNGFFKMDSYRLRHSTPDGGMSGEITRELFERGNAAAVLVYDDERDTVLLVEEFRIGNYGAGLPDEECWSLAPIAGVIDPGEDGAACVLREAVEEAGILLKDEDLVGPWRYMSSPGGTSETLEIFIARAWLDKPLEPEGNDADEFTRPVIMPREKVMQMIGTSLVPASLMIAMLWLDRFVKEKQEKAEDHGT